MLARAGLLLHSTLLLRPPHAPVRCLASVSGIVYAAADEGAPKVSLFTKEGCTLCDKAKEVLRQAATDVPHTLEAVDITDPEQAHWWGKYKYDIPVLHVDGQYWAKHRITLEDSLEALASARDQRFEPRLGEPDAERLERRK